jgi:hypothetical protein
MHKHCMKRNQQVLNSTTDVVCLVNDVYPWARPKTLKGILSCAGSTGCLIPISFAIGINSTYNFHIILFVKIESH